MAAADPNSESAPSVVLVGPRGAGKTTLAAPLAAALGCSHDDTDAMIAAEVGQSAGTFLAAAGEARFREVEERIVLAALAANAGRVLALGGGAVLSAKTRRELARVANFVVFVHAPEEVLVERTRNGPERPPLTGLPPSDEVRALLRERLPLYREVADHSVDTFSANVTACVRSIVGSMGRAGG